MKKYYYKQVGNGTIWLHIYWNSWFLGFQYLNKCCKDKTCRHTPHEFIIHVGPIQFRAMW